MYRPAGKRNLYRIIARNPQEAKLRKARQIDVGRRMAETYEVFMDFCLKFSKAVAWVREENGGVLALAVQDEVGFQQGCATAERVIGAPERRESNLPGKKSRVLTSALGAIMLVERNREAPLMCGVPPVLAIKGSGAVSEALQLRATSKWEGAQVVKTLNGWSNVSVHEKWVKENLVPLRDKLAKGDFHWIRFTFIIVLADLRARMLYWTLDENFRFLVETEILSGAC